MSLNVYSSVFCNQRQHHSFHCLQVGLDKALALAWTLIHASWSVAQQTYAYIIKEDVTNLASYIAANKAAVLAGCCDVVEVDTANLAAFAFNLSLGESPVGILVIAVGTWIAGHVDRLCLSPPYIAPQASIQLDIREDNICHSALVAILYTQTSV